VKPFSTPPQVAGSVEERLRDELIRDIVSQAGLCGVGAGIAIRLVARESGFRQFDKDGKPLRSHSGAIGLTQIKPSSALEISPTLDVEWNPTDNLKAGFCLLSKYRRGGDWKTALIRYRLGPHAVRTPAAVAYANTILAGEAQ
jgi:soluble lytic murein transglycosylase-like protein